MASLSIVPILWTTSSTSILSSQTFFLHHMKSCRIRLHSDNGRTNPQAPIWRWKSWDGGLVVQISMVSREMRSCLSMRKCLRVRILSASGLPLWLQIMDILRHGYEHLAMVFRQLLFMDFARTPELFGHPTTITRTLRLNQYLKSYPYLLLHAKPQATVTASSFSFWQGLPATWIGWMISGPPDWRNCPLWQQHRPKPSFVQATLLGDKYFCKGNDSGPC